MMTGSNGSEDGWMWPNRSLSSVDGSRREFVGGEMIMVTFPCAYYAQQQLGLFQDESISNHRHAAEATALRL